MADNNYLRASSGAGDAALMHVTTTRASGATTIAVDLLTNVPTKFIATYGNVLPSGLLDPTTMVNFKGRNDGTALQIDTFEPGSVDNGNTIGQVVIIKPTTGWANRVAAFMENISGFGTPDTLFASTLNLATGLTTPAQSISGASITQNTLNPLALKKPIAARGYMVNDFVVATNIWSRCDLAVEYINGITQTADGGFLIPYTGLYMVIINVTHIDNPVGAGGNVLAGMFTALGTGDVPGATPGWYQRVGFSSNPTTISMSRLYQLGAGTQVYLKTYASGNGANYRCRGSNGSDPTTMELVYLGPAS